MIIFGAERLGLFSRNESRFPLQSFVPNPDTKGFSLQPGLKGDICFFAIIQKTTVINLKFITGLLFSARYFESRLQ